MRPRILLLFVSVLFTVSLLKAQGNKISITATLPTSLTVCGAADTFSINLLNITSGGLSSVTFTVQFPGGINYVSSSINGSGVTESNISNLNAPVFAVPNMVVGSSYSFKFRANASCGVITYLNGGGAITNSYTANYTGNYDRLISNPYTIKIPNLVITAITNQTFTGNLNNIFVRTFTITNTGQGSISGFTFRQINKNGLQLRYYNGGSTVASGDTITHTFSASNFTGIGNFNSTFDYQESVIIRDTIKIIACSNFNSSFLVWWGCNNSICQQNSNAGNVILNQQLPNLVVSPQPSLNTCYGSNIASPQLLTLLNNGNGPAKNLVVNIYQPGNLYSRIDTSSITIKTGINGTFAKLNPTSVTNTSNSGSLSCLGSNPIGGFVTSFGTLNAGDTIYIKWNAYSCCPQDCNGYPATMGWLYNGTYKDQCMNSTYNIINSWGRYYDQAGMSLLPTTPSDIITGQTKIFRYLITNYSLFTMNNSNTDFELDVTLPAGIKWISGNIANANGTAFWNPVSSSYTGNIYKAFFTGPPPFYLLQSEFIFNLQGDCSMSGSGTGNKTISIAFKHRPNRSCSDSCSIPILCTTTDVYLHCGSNCPTGGMIFQNYNIQRSSFGKPDNDNDGLADTTGVLNLSKVRYERAMVGDTITAVFTGIVKTGGPNTNFQYGYAHSAIVNGIYLTNVGASVKLKRGTSGAIYTCNNVAVSSTIAGTTSTFAYDFSIPTVSSVGGCMSPGYRYNNHDTITLTVKYKVGALPAGAVLNSTVSNDYYLCNVANPTLAGNIFECDTFSGNFVLIGYYFTNYGKDVFSHNSCSNITLYQSYYLSIGNCCSNYAGGNLFPFEYRSWGHLKEATFIKPHGYTFVSASINQGRTSGTLQVTTQTVPSIAPANSNSDTLVFNAEAMYKGYGGTVDSSDDGFYGTLAVTLSPTCAVTQNVTQYFPTSFVFKENAILSNGYIDFPPGSQTDEGTYLGPNISVVAALDTVKGLGDTAYWDITVFNTSASSTASNVWVAFQTTPTTTIAGVTNNLGAPVTSANGIYKLGTMTPSSQKSYRIKATYRSCFKDSIQIFSGADCPAYPASLASYNCNVASRVLYVTPQMPGFQGSITDSVSVLNLCTVAPYTIIINNFQEATAYNLRVQVTLPVGLTVVPATTRLYYPFSSAARTISNPVLISGTTYEWNLSTLDTTIGKYGVKGVIDTARSSVKIKFYVKTDCNYSSGGILRIKTLSTSACGAFAPQLQAVSNQLKIVGVTTPYFALVQMNSDTINPCSANSTLLKIHIFNIGLDSTRYADYYQVMLPAGMQYVVGSFTPVHNAPSTGSPTINNINGQQMLEWQIPPLIPRLDSIDFTFNITVTDHRPLLCGRNDIYSQAVVKQSVLCVATNTYCLINSITGYNLNPMVIQKGSVAFTSFGGSAQASPPSSEILSLNYTLLNGGSRIDSTSTVFVKFYFDADSNGVYSAGDLLLNIDTVNTTLLKNASLSRSKTFAAPAGKTCTLIAVADTGSCICATSQKLFLDPPLPFAGIDKILCSNFADTIGIDSLSGYSYSWLPVAGLSNPGVAKPRVSIINPGLSTQVYKYFVTARRGACNYTDTVDIRVYPVINAHAGIDRTICPGDSVQIGLPATGGTPPFRYKWMITTAMQNDTLATTWVKPVTTTSYIVKVTDALNCVFYDTAVVNISPWPIAKFSFNDACISDTITFTDSSTISAGFVSNWLWNFGDGGSSIVQNPKHKYVNAGNYAVKLLMQSNYGCKDSTTDTVHVYPPPVAGFSYASNCFGDSTLFTDTTSLSMGSLSSWYWEFSTGDTSTSRNPKYLFDTTGTFQVMLTVYTTHGCVDTISHFITISPKPKAGFSADVKCRYDSVAFSDTSSIVSGSIVQRLWKFGDSTTSLLKNPKHLYAYSGNKNVSLMVTSSKGCVDSTSASIIVKPVPVTNFSIADICYKDTASFSNLSTGATMYQWYFGDGQTSALISPSHYYNAAGNYTVKLITSNAFGCFDSAIKTITVNPKPGAAFTVASICEYDSAIFNNYSTITGGAIAFYQWNFGDGQTSMLTNPKHLYATGGSYNVKLKVISNKGCADSTSSFLLIYSKPKARISASVACHNDTTFFTDNSTANVGSIIQRLWSFGDGTSSTQTNPFHSYTDTGYFIVKLRVVNSTNCIDSTQMTIYVNPKPVANFNAIPACEDDSLKFFDNTSITRGSITQYLWNFGDGFTSTLKNPAHVYINPGSYTVMLKVASDSTCGAFVQKNVTVYPKPKPDFYIRSTCYKDSVSFIDTASAITTPYTIISYFYQFGDGLTSTLQNPKHKYATAGSYNVTLVCTSDKGCLESVTKLIKVASIPQPGFYTLNPCLLDSMQFMDTTVSASPVTYRKWYFGDGATSLLLNPKHYYFNAGTYTVSLVCKNGNNCSDSVAHPVIIYPKPRARFVASDACPNTIIPIADLSSSNGSIITKYFWTFSDGYTDTSHIPQHACTNCAGNAITIKLRIETDHGCTDTTSKTIRIFTPPVAAFTFDTVCLGNYTRFYDHSIANAASMTSWNYSFDDSTTSNNRNGTHLFKTSGWHSVLLTVINGSGCIDSISKTILVTDLPDIHFTASSIAGCYPLTVQFKDSSLLTFGTKIKWLWDFGDKRTDTISDPIHTYTKPGSYTVSLRVTSSYQCSSQKTISNYITVYALPKAAFDVIPDSTSDFTPEIPFINLSTGSTQWYWNFGNATTSSDQDPTVTYTDTGHYNVQLIAESKDGCLDTAYRKVVITPGFSLYIPNAFSPNNDPHQTNEKWGPGGTYRGVKQYKLTIYDRWGSLVFSTETISDFWDGMMSDKKTPAPVDAYIYSMMVLDYYNKEHFYKGTIELVR
jgi:gliding motility-associated-like protein